MKNVSVVILPYHLITISTFHPTSMGGYSYSIGAPVSIAWSAANRAVYIPFRLPTVITATIMFLFNGAAVNGNLDIGIYDEGGTRLISSGAVAQAGISQIQSVDITDTRFGPGLFYMALALDNNVGTVYQSGPGTVRLRAAGCVMEEGAFPLPAVAAFISYATSLPLFGFTTRGFV